MGNVLMCGICGVFGSEDKRLIKSMTRILRHRGPDGEGYHIDKDLMLGHRRLSVIDLATGDQPIYNEDRSICVIDNGEIYNFKDLRKELEKSGHKFYTKSDTEVVVHAYEEWGDECFEKFQGMFSIVIWDSIKRRLVLARDRHGIKSVFHTLLPEGDFLFASEVKAILQDTRVKRELDYESFHYFANLRYVPREKTMFKGIQRLLPGHILVADKNGVRIKKFHKPAFKLTTPSENKIIKALRKTLKQAVKRHMVSDVPIGICLSGGLDSTTLVALASKLSDEPPRTFCMGFGEDTDEIEDANMVADHFNTNHRNLIVKANLLKEYPTMIWHADSPKRNLYPYYLSELVGRHVKVALSGLGGDELYGGYTWKYRLAENVEKARKKLTRSQKANLMKSAKQMIIFQSKYGDITDDRHFEYLKKMLYMNSDVDLYLGTQSLDETFPEEYLARLYGKEMRGWKIPSVRSVFAPYFNGKSGLVQQFMEVDYQVKMADDFLFVEDSMFSAHSLESRVPLLDNDLVDYSFSIPPEMKWQKGQGKVIFKKAIKPWVPKFVFEKRKQGFGSNVFLTYVDEIEEIARQKLPDGNAVKEGLIRKEYLEDVLGREASPHLTKHYCLIWNLLTFEIWHEMYIKSDKIQNPTKGVGSII
jgi:asparagine synthase (glutamine-hydrolysing)